jgi:hypothetical protein
LDLTGKKPRDVIEVIVQDIGLVKAVHAPNGSSIDYTVNDNILTFELPNDITDGPVVMLPASGVPVAIANIGVAIPADLAATPDTDIKEGDEITVTGVNMDLVTTVTFPGVENAVDLTFQSATIIKVTVPGAVISGDLVLNTASGKTVSVVISTLKPEILAYQPDLVAAGSNVTVTGKNLNLIKTVTFGGGKVGEIVSSSATELIVTVPVDAETGEVTLTMTNGETTEGASLTITKPFFAYIPVLPGSDVEIKAGDILQVAIENGDMLTGVQVNNVTVQYILAGSTLNVLIPDNAGGKTALKLISFNGEVSYDIQVIGNSTIETTIYTGPIELSGWDNNFSIDKTAFENVAAGSIMKIYYAPTGGGDAQIKLNDDDWKVIELTGDPNFSSQWGTLSLPGDATSYEITLTADILTRILTYVASWNNLAGTIIAGQNVIIAKITLITKGGGAAETTIYDDPIDLVGWGNNFSILKKAFENVKAGSTMTVYYTPTGSDTQIKLNDDDWKVIELIGDPNFSSQWGTLTLPGDATSYEITLTADVLTRILTYVASWNNPAGLIIAGQNVTISKITIK